MMGKRKYIEEIVRPWFVFGVHPDGRVDLSDGNRDVFTKLEPAVAEELIALRERHITEVHRAVEDGQA